LITDSDTYVEREEFGNPLLRMLMILLPVISTEGDDFSKLEPIEPSKRHFKLATVSLALTISVAAVIYWQVPLLRNSVITMLGNLVGFITDSPSVAAWFILVANMVMVVLIIRKLTSSRGAIPDAALLEEKMFRAGSEGWNWHQRLRSNAIFGAGHLFNLIVFLAIVPGLAAGGWWFMYIYRRTYQKTNSRNAALQEAGAVHAAHNRLVLYSLPLVFVGLIIFLAVHPISK
jgi:hypothetical protein